MFLAVFCDSIGMLINDRRGAHVRRGGNRQCGRDPMTVDLSRRQAAERGMRFLLSLGGEKAGEIERIAAPPRSRGNALSVFA